ncbi:PREDICTED: E3 ubiquitin-protein ligase RNF13-like [Nelumbo nucifera]|uniref:RING-type domain-containing protein n=2 Tax=Nelumbo nucifera TaxID=4432 RepID=A0A822YQ20_NELNU|nr:PREDICTED: E3 ubiquitin-protein ligase RNF13-like [Nelumbo nucifera]DAD34617.1 TPA_asm: hypothetical protein HUJ06_005257 [Nelumbo nucifera]
MSNKVVGIATEIVVMAVVLSVILLFLGICVVVFIHVCIVGRALRRGFTRQNLVERANGGANSMSHDDLQRLPCFDFRAGEKGSSPIDCVVCLENFKVGDKCRLLPCKHSFHANCVDSWLLKTPVCPICRTSAYPQKAGMVVGEESSHSVEVPSEFMETRPVEVGSRLSSNPPTLQASASEFSV